MAASQITLHRLMTQRGAESFSDLNMIGQRMTSQADISS